MSVLSDTELRQQEHIIRISDEIAILNLAEKSLTFFGVNDNIKSSSTFQLIYKKRDKLLGKLARHTYIIEKMRFNDFKSGMMFDEEAVARELERANSVFYQGFPSAETFTENEQMETDIANLDAARYN